MGARVILLVSDQHFELRERPDRVSSVLELAIYTTGTMTMCVRRVKQARVAVDVARAKQCRAAQPHLFIRLSGQVAFSQASQGVTPTMSTAAGARRDRHGTQSNMLPPRQAARWGPGAAWERTSVMTAMSRLNSTMTRMMAIATEMRGPSQN